GVDVGEPPFDVEQAPEVLDFEAHTGTVAIQGPHPGGVRIVQQVVDVSHGATPSHRFALHRRRRTSWRHSSQFRIGARSAGSKYSSMRLIRLSAFTVITMQTRSAINPPFVPVACRMCCWTKPPGNNRRSSTS